MRTLIVLGIIPGTNITISFKEWLGMLDVLIGAYFILRIERQQRGFARVTSRLVLHATQLHQRA